MGKAKIVCCWLWCIFSVVLTAVMIWLLIVSSNIDKPQCSIQYFYVPALNKSLNSQPLNATLNFMLGLDNPNKMNGIYYDDVIVYISNTNTFNSSNSSLLALYTVPKFYQGLHKKAKKWGQALPFNDQSLLRAVLPNGSAVFRLELRTRVRYDRISGRTFGVEVGANVEVDGEGAKAAKEEIKMMKSDSSSLLISSFLVCVLINLLVFFAIR